MGLDTYLGLRDNNCLQVQQPVITIWANLTQWSIQHGI